MPKHQVTDLQRTRARQLRRDLTEPEEKLWRLLRSRRLAHIKFRRQTPIGPWITDFVSHEFKLIIEADGSQHAENTRDTQRDTDLAHRGYRVLRFWNNDIMQNTEGVLERILEAVDESSSKRRSRWFALPPGGEGIYSSQHMRLGEGDSLSSSTAFVEALPPSPTRVC